eukprot:TRINITY_DN2540_c0_g1_i2.p1 TRINITY_DN2540_c0_g1~~TRINITY_DN2540_c0_g1_i2.p1  ORF type:complete len:102 (+),score=9.31 TRINITY_DN2540_c0_g1_i2:50-355(+)
MKSCIANRLKILQIERGESLEGCKAGGGFQLLDDIVGQEIVDTALGQDDAGSGSTNARATATSNIEQMEAFHFEGGNLREAGFELIQNLTVAHVLCVDTTA